MNREATGPRKENVQPQLIGGRYRVERELGRGGMATVYLCTDERDGTRVAVKLLRPELGSAVVVERFLREIAFASELEHPQIPRVMDSGVEGEVPYYVMTYIEGESLRSHLDRVKQMPIDDAVRIICEAIKPTAYAHAHGIIHRDIKPANILISKDAVFVLDFGVARAIMASAEEGLTSTGIAVGTPAYMSPEQALADHNLDARSDIYSLGCLIYEMIAGIPPFVGATAQAVMARRFVAPPPPLRETRDGVPETVERAVAKALTRAPADRWQTVEAFAEALSLDPVADTLQIARVALERRRRRYALWIVAATVLVLGGVWAAAWSVSRRDYVERAQMEIGMWNFEAARAQLKEAIAREPDDPHLQLWLAQLTMILGDPTAEWQRLALRAADKSAMLDSSDRQRASALVAFAAGEEPNPCAGFEKLASRPSQRAENITNTLALADCLVSDKRVVADPAGNAGMAFRASLHRAAELYEGLVARNSTNGEAYGFLVPRLEKVLWTNKNKLRQGWLLGQQERVYVAWPELDADTLSYRPVLLRDDAPLRENAEQVDKVVARNLEKLQAIAIAWTRAAPKDPHAHETLARMLETSGKLDGPSPSALGEIRIARGLAPRQLTDPGTMVRYLWLASTNVRLLLKLQRFSAAAAAADSAIRFSARNRLSDSLQYRADSIVVGLASLTGHPRLMNEIQQKYVAEFKIQLRSGEQRIPPVEVGSDAQRLLTYAAFGAPRDSIFAIIGRISDNLTAVIPSGQVSEVRTAMLTLPIALAAPSIGPSIAASLGPTNDVIANAVKALAAGNIPRARIFADSLSSLYAERAPGEVTMDAVLPYSWILVSVGDTVQASRFLDNALRGLSRAPPTMLLSQYIPSSLVRVMILRSELARKTGDSITATRWERAARELWSRADPEAASLLFR